MTRLWHGLRSGQDLVRVVFLHDIQVCYRRYYLLAQIFRRVREYRTLSSQEEEMLKRSSVPLPLLSLVPSAKFLLADFHMDIGQRLGGAP